MKIEKKIVSLSIIALVLGIIAILPIMLYAPSVAEPQNVPNSFRIVNVDTSTPYENDDIPDSEDGIPLWVAVPSTELGENYITLMPIEEFHEIYGYNATIPQIPYHFMFKPNIGD